MRDLTERNKANKTDPVVNETVYVNATGLRGLVIHIGPGEYTKSTFYTILMENGETTVRLRREIIRVPQ